VCIGYESQLKVELPVRWFERDRPITQIAPMLDREERGITESSTGHPPTDNVAVGPAGPFLGYILEPGAFG